MMGGEMTKNDPFTLSLMTNADVLAIEKESWCAHPLRTEEEESVWVAPRKDGQGCYVALFNLGETERTVSVAAEALEKTGTFSARELWSGQSGTCGDTVSAVLPPHDAAVFLIC